MPGAPRRRGTATAGARLVADARRLDAVAGSDFDAALLMGPLYHLFGEEDRKKALAEIAPLHEALGFETLAFETTPKTSQTTP